MKSFLLIYLSFVGVVTFIVGLAHLVMWLGAVLSPPLAFIIIAPLAPALIVAAVMGAFEKPIDKVREWFYD